MKVLILAAGYATRLYPLTLNKPKPLLTVGSKSILGHIFDKIAQLDTVETCYIVTNERFYNIFREWAANFKSKTPIEVINDETTTNENRLGAIRDIEYVIKKKGIKDDLLVVGGDNIFEFSLKGFVDFAGSQKPNVTLAVFDVGSLEQARLYGVIKTDDSNKVVSFDEKPSQPKSTLIATCVYYFPKDRVGLISEFLSSGNKTDAPGNYIKWLSENHGVSAFAFKDKWYDIGDKKSLDEADREFKV